MQVGVVTYAAATSPDGPIAGRRFFAPHAQAWGPVGRREPALGLGTACGVTDVGLAALEGYAAVLEVSTRDLLSYEGRWRRSCAT
jgi:hypothetical protein